jgi:hypothetical protein
MTDRPYSDNDLRVEAARQHAALTEDPDFMGVGEQMQDTEIDSLLPPAEADGAEGPHWDEVLNEDQFDEAQRKIHDLINGAADISQWAIDLGADGLEPEDHTLSVDGDGKPLVRLHCAFHPDMDDRARIAFISGLAKAMANAL